VSHDQPTMPELLEEIDRLRRERDEAIARVAELEEREEVTRAELRDLRTAVERLTGGLTDFLEAARPAGPPGSVHPIRPRRDDE
jgi:uncharacterized coiled-coil DUF342 family protein